MENYLYKHLKQNIFQKILNKFILYEVGGTKKRTYLENNVKFLRYKNSNFKIIGSAHNFKEVTLKVKQGCSFILLSKLFLVNYNKCAPFLGIVKFNYFSKISKKIIPLGGIKVNNLNQLKSVFGEGFALLSEIKKKPAIIRRLF